MKTCAYCGRENEEAAVQCRECGTTEFKGRTTTPPSSPAEVGRPPVVVPGLLLLGVGVVLLGIAVGFLAMGRGQVGGALLGLLFAKVLALSSLIRTAKVRLSWPRFLTAPDKKTSRD